MATKIVRQTIKCSEDAHWLKEAQERERTFSRKSALIHKQVWNKKITTQKPV